MPVDRRRRTRWFEIVTFVVRGSEDELEICSPRVSTEIFVTFSFSQILSHRLISQSTIVQTLCDTITIEMQISTDDEDRGIHSLFLDRWTTFFHREFSSRQIRTSFRGKIDEKPFSNRSSSVERHLPATESFFRVASKLLLACRTQRVRYPSSCCFSIAAKRTSIFSSLVDIDSRIFLDLFSSFISINRMSALARFTLSAPTALGRLGQLLAQRQVLPVVSSASAWTNQRSISTSVVRRDIDSAAKYIGAGAATVGVAGAGAGKSMDEFGFPPFSSSSSPPLRYRNSLRFIGRRLCPKPKLETTAVLLRHSWFRFVRSHGSLLPDDGFHVSFALTSNVEPKERFL